MGKLKPPYTDSVTVAPAQTTASITLQHNNYNQVWVIEQIACFYNKPVDTPQITILKNEQIYAGPAQVLPGNTGLGQTFGGLPYLYKEVDDDVKVVVSNATAGGILTIQIQYRDIGYDDPELNGRF